MTHRTAMASNSAIRAALAGSAYDRGDVRIVDPDLTGWDWLATTHRGVFAVANGRIKLVLHGWFFGLCRHGDRLYVFENCGHRDLGSDRTGAYLHINTIARVGDRIGLVLHNGKALPEKHSEVAWLDADWSVIDRRPLPGHQGDVRLAADAWATIWSRTRRGGYGIRCRARATSCVRTVSSCASPATR